MAGEIYSAFVRYFVKDEVSGEVKKVESAADKATQSMDKAADSAGGKLSGGFSKAKSAAATAAKGFAAIGGAVVAGVTGMFKLVSATEETRENLAKLDTAWEASGNSVEQGRKSYEDFYGLVGDSDQAAEASQNIARLTTNQEELNQWTNISAGAFAAFGDALPVENLTETAQESAKTGKVVGSLADALNWSTASSETFSSAMSGHKDAQAAFNSAIEEGATKEDAFNAALEACSDEQERSSLITATLNGLYGETGQKYLENNKALIDSRKAQAEWNNAMAGAAKAVMPATTAIQQMGADLLTKAMPYLQQFADWIASNIPAVQQFVTETADKIVQAWTNAQPVLQPVFDVIKGVFQWFIDNLPIIAPVVAAVVSAIMGFNVVSGIVGTVVGVFVKLKSVIEFAKLAFDLLKLAFMANPFGLIIGIITVLIGIFINLWNTNEEFRNAVINIWNSIKEAATNVFNGIKDFLSTTWQNIKTTCETVWNAIKNFFTNYYTNLFILISTVWNAIKNAISTVVNGIRDTVSNVFNAVRNTVSNIFNGIRNTASSIWNGIKNTISNAVNGIRNSISNAFYGAYNTASSVFNSIRNAISNAIIGARNIVSNAVESIKGMFNFSWSLPHINIPHFSISGGEPPFGFGGKGSFPSISVEWYAKAMDNAMLLDRATIFGASGGQLLGGGEAGTEVVSGAETLMRMIRNAVADVAGGVGYVANINVTTGETSEDRLARMIARENRRLAYDFGAL